MSPLRERVTADLAQALPAEIRDFAQHLAENTPDALAVLFYGSVLRTGRLEDLLDFYVLTEAGERRPLIWPSISFDSAPIGNQTLRAKVATMPLAVFADAAGGDKLDTTIWTRFCQPSALAWSRDTASAEAVSDAIASAIATAASYAAALGPEWATAQEFWVALFDRTYEAELRVEAPGRSATIVSHEPQHYADLLPLAWAEAGIRFFRKDDVLRPEVPARLTATLRQRWRKRARLGKAMNVVRLVRAAVATRGAGSYALWKIERHTGVRIEDTPWRRAHPILATPGVLWQLSRARGRTSKA